MNETIEQRDRRRQKEEDARRRFILQRWARCWSQRWQPVERDGLGLPTRFLALSNAEMSKAAQGIPVVVPKGLFR